MLKINDTFLIGDIEITEQYEYVKNLEQIVQEIITTTNIIITTPINLQLDCKLVHVIELETTILNKYTCSLLDFCYKKEHYTYNFIQINHKI